VKGPGCGTIGNLTGSTENPLEILRLVLGISILPWLRLFTSGSPAAGSWPHVVLVIICASIFILRLCCFPTVFQTPGDGLAAYRADEHRWIYLYDRHDMSERRAQAMEIIGQCAEAKTRIALEPCRLPVTD
jgi:hypothetical protein